MRKYDVYLPLNYNDGEPIESTKITAICDELALTFGAITTSPLPHLTKAVGSMVVWSMLIEIMKVEILTSGDKVTKQFLKDFKERLQKGPESRSIS